MAAGWCDALGTIHPRAGADARIACLVPSITELVCALGLLPQLVARTGFCIHPRPAIDAVPKVGGTKDVNLARLRALRPTHVIVNIDENEKPAAEAIAAFVPHIVVTHPQAPEDNLALYRLIGGIFGRADRAEALCAELSAAMTAARVRCAALPRERVLYLIWKDPWMTVAPDTYISRTLAAVGWDTVPAQAARRYPVVDLPAAAAGADRVLLSTEPYRFGAADADALARALPGCAVHLIDGEMTSWYGPRAIAGLAYLAGLRGTLAGRAG
ncbi:MAG: ABC transporter substrate-binding protein [Burkholderiales bacterium]|nr:ABC transporter substrate-binding protein [Burkholderiales bacterium]